MDVNSGDLTVSVIIPVMNEEDNVFLLADEIDKAMNVTKWKWECLWVDDKSTDNTVEKLKQLTEKSPNHRLILHSQNYGQSAALATGFRHAAGNILATLDGDGQNDPAFLPALLNKLIDEDADMVNGLRQRRQDNVIKKISSRIANGFRNLLTRENIRDVGCALRVFRKYCVRDIPVFKGMHRFLPTLVRLAGYTKILEMPVCHRKRERGVTKYGINNRLWVGILDTLAVCWMQSRMVYPKTKKREQD